MEPVDQRLILIQDEIRESFGWDLQSDYESAKSLVSKCKNPTASIKFDSKVTVVGAAAESQLITEFPTIVADGAIGAIADLSTVALIVTDGDGTPYLEQALNLGVGVDSLRVDPLLARGLDYYTGAIFEVVVEDAPVGSICGGGRYADLTGIFGWKGVSGVGVSFGADRIEDVLNHVECWPALSSVGLDVMVAQMESGDVEAELAAAQACRQAGLSSELYPDAAKFKKQFKYANDRGVRWVMVLGEDERASGVVSLKDMVEGHQDQLPLPEAIAKIQAS